VHDASGARRHAHHPQVLPARIVQILNLSSKFTTITNSSQIVRGEPLATLDFACDMIPDRHRKYVLWAAKKAKFLAMSC
jgi:hypothetical protein